MTFDYVAPTSVAEAVQLLERHGPDAHVMAGGSALMLLYKQGLVRPGVVVALHQVEGLRGIRRLDDGGLWVGAMTTHRQVETSALVAAYCPALARTFASIATVRIRNQATIGGNLAHADPAQDPPPMLMALDAVVEITGPAGERTSTLDTFFRDIFETSLEPGELITGIRFPAQAARTVASYTKFLPRTEDDYATVSVAVRLVRDAGGRAVAVAVCLGAAGPTPIRARRAEQALAGAELTMATITDAAALVGDDVDPLDDFRGSIAYKRRTAVIHTRRALLALAGS